MREREASFPLKRLMVFTAHASSHLPKRLFDRRGYPLPGCGAAPPSDFGQAAIEQSFALCDRVGKPEVIEVSGEGEEGGSPVFLVQEGP